MADDDEVRAVERERWRALRLIEGWLEGPMMVLGLVWLVLLVVEFTTGLSRFMRDVGTLIWVAFLFDFALRFVLAPGKLTFLRRNLLTVVSLALPAFRTLRILRLAGMARGLRFVRVLGTVNRGLASVRRATQRRGLGYVLLATLLVVAVGSAGLFAFERGLAVEGGGFDSYSTALWWTARIVMTVGPEFWPQTPEGRLLSLMLALYGYATFGYVTAALASLFVDRDAASARGEVAGRRRIDSLHAEIRALREDLRRQ